MEYLRVTHVLSQEPIEAHKDLTYEEKPIKILDRQDKRFRNKVILLVKVLWKNHKTREEDMRTQYPELF